MSSDDLRDGLRARQTALARALTTGSEAPPGFDAARIDAAHRALAVKQRREAARLTLRTSRTRPKIPPAG